ncbi:hypothetical protein [Mesorhizobium sp. B1-1-7]|uniref:hypothetical protein n=1 Tax=Mesorhizobium sp. B1-1-7 TaxID=2589977 RepID=UPI0011273236|nr:hypothetical protein [Mesorhizobium sp. B1-1-7]TPN53996.1 hypothetical protein FJ978_07790 [Mesorhizobium sp. B1-1-7]
MPRNAQNARENASFAGCKIKTSTIGTLFPFLHPLGLQQVIAFASKLRPKVAMVPMVRVISDNAYESQDDRPMPTPSQSYAYTPETGTIGTIWITI